MVDLWPFLIPVFLGGILTCIGYIYGLKTKVAVLEETIEHLKNTIEGMHRRMDSHSKKNDEIVNLITSLKMEVIQRIGEVATEMSKLSSDVDNINRSFMVFDSGIKKVSRKK